MIFCEFDYCIYNKENTCILKAISISSSTNERGGLDDIVDRCWLKFYKNYPKKIDKKRAESAYKKHLGKHTSIKAVTDKAFLIFKNLKRQAVYWTNRYGDDTQHIPSPLKWIDGEKWNDEIPDGGGD